MADRGRVQTRLLPLLVASALALGVPGGASAGAAVISQSGAYAATLDYMVHFYPRWFTDQQAGSPIDVSRLFGPDRVSPIYHVVVAINVDTLYASTFVDVSSEPAVLTVPATTVSYSLLPLDVYGNIIQTNIPAGTAGTYAITGPGWTGTLPAGVTQVPVPVDFSAWIFRADKYTNGVNTIREAQQFRRSVRVATLSQYLRNPLHGRTQVVPEIFFATPYKQIADTECRRAPIEFLNQLQSAMHAPTTPPLAAADQQLSDRFDALFGDGSFLSPSARAQFARAVRTAHKIIVAHYHSHTIGRNWINFTNIGIWGNHNLDRDAITEYIQYANNHSAAAYYHTFKDARGVALNGRRHDYVLTFAKGQAPEAKRFWSLTAYLPRSIELVPNRARKYAVASYTPHLKTSRDGSTSIYMAPRRPHGVPKPNWLPIPRGHFNAMLRVYGPEGSVANGTYVPPAINRLN